MTAQTKRSAEWIYTYLCIKQKIRRRATTSTHAKQSGESHLPAQWNSRTPDEEMHLQQARPPGDADHGEAGNIAWPHISRLGRGQGPRLH